MKQLVASPWLHGCCNTVSPSLATRRTRLVQASWEPISQARPRLRAAPIGLREICLPSLRNLPRAKHPLAELCWHCASRVRARTSHALRFPDAQAFSPVSYTHLRAHETPEHLVCR